jgi:hypothetical protein
VASGDIVVHVLQIMPPLNNFATLTTRTGGSSPTERVPCYAFDASTDEYLDFYCALRGYGGGGLTFGLTSMAASATTGGALVALAIRAFPDETEALTAIQTYDYNEIRIPAPATISAFTYDTITFTAGADMDNLADGQDFLLRMRRRGSDSTASTGDDMAGDWQLLALIGRET